MAKELRGLLYAVPWVSKPSTPFLRWESQIVRKASDITLNKM